MAFYCSREICGRGQAQTDAILRPGGLGQESDARATSVMGSDHTPSASQEACLGLDSQGRKPAYNKKT